MSSNERDQQNAGVNDTGFNADTDFYSLLNCPPTANVKQIEKSFKKLSLSVHPDKYRSRQVPHGDPNFVPIEADNELTKRQEVFLEMQKAYKYLTNPLTKVIYDEFGIPGLAVYEKQKNKFQDL